MMDRVFGNMPTRPVIIITPIVAVLVLAFYYWDLHDKCDRHKQHRLVLEQLNPVEFSDGTVRLADYMGFTWDKLRVFSDFEPNAKSLDCPFEWGWSEDDLKALQQPNSLTVMVFSHQDRILEYLELRKDRLRFSETDEKLLTPDTAIFKLENQAGADNGIVLTHVPQVSQ